MYVIHLIFICNEFIWLNSKLLHLDIYNFVVICDIVKTGADFIVFSYLTVESCGGKKIMWMGNPS